MRTNVAANPKTKKEDMIQILNTQPVLFSENSTKKELLSLILDTTYDQRWAYFVSATAPAPKPAATVVETPKATPKPLKKEDMIQQLLLLSPTATVIRPGKGHVQLVPKGKKRHTAIIDPLRKFFRVLCTEEIAAELPQFEHRPSKYADVEIRITQDVDLIAVIAAVDAVNKRHAEAAAAKKAAETVAK